MRHAFYDGVHICTVVDVFVREHYHVGGGDFKRGARGADVREASGPRVYDALTFTSASAVEGFLLSCPGADLSHLPALCIGPETGKKAAEMGMDVTLSPEATIDSMIDTLIGGFFHD